MKNYLNWFIEEDIYCLYNICKTDGIWNNIFQLGQISIVAIDPGWMCLVNIYILKKTFFYLKWHGTKSARQELSYHYTDVIMGTMASQITNLMIVYSTVYSGADQRKHQSSASLAFVRGIHRSPVKSLHKWPVTRKMFPFHDVIMFTDYQI